MVWIEADTVDAADGENHQHQDPGLLPFISQLPAQPATLREMLAQVAGMCKLG